ncbi:hypothetical protein Tco_0893505 [Tanacetum coccineum]|uniref:Uncharacterized protein n=1 Tax=Tanacetum coccineum TaxID=301880 RepID=A0ABQ5CBV5_9ASTR
MPHDSPFHDVHSHRSAKGSVQQHDLMVLVTKLNDRIDGFEKDLQQTKKTYSTALTKRSVTDKGKAIMEEPATLKKVKKRTQVQLSMDEELARKIEEEERIRFNAEQEARALNLSEMEISTASPPKVTKVSTAKAYVYTRRKAKDKGKAIMVEHATPKKVKKRNQVQLSMDEELARKMEEEERARFNVEQEAKTLQEEEEEKARFNAEQEARALQEEEEERLNLEAAWELQK